jgi:hypothetical protein
VDTEQNGKTIDRVDEARTVQQIVEIMDGRSEASQRRILQAALTILGHDQNLRIQTGQEVASDVNPTGIPRSYPGFTEDTAMSPKQFMLEKQPRSDVERIACLAYYLTHFLDTPHFKTVDLSKLNTEAAQPRFSNAANSANNALKQGYLVQATKGNRQLSAAGEQFVRSLPDREAAKTAMATTKPRKRTTRRVSRKPDPAP